VPELSLLLFQSICLALAPFSPHSFPPRHPALNKEEFKLMTKESTVRRRGRPSKNANGQSKPGGNQTLEVLLGPTPLLHGEDEVGYKAFYDNFRQQVGPHDLIDEIYIRDVVDQTWEIHRLRKIRIGTMRKGQMQAVRQYADLSISPSMNSKQCDVVRDQMKISLESALDCLQNFGVTLLDINARAFKNEDSALFDIDQNITRLEVRRNYTLREIERRKSAFAKQIIRVVNSLEDNKASKSFSASAQSAVEG
jgi:hypothetical protein